MPSLVARMQAADERIQKRPIDDDSPTSLGKRKMGSGDEVVPF